MINIIGLGYIGLPTALAFAAAGLKVVGTDYNFDLVESLKKGKLNFEEEGLEDLFQAALKNEIEFTTEYRTTDTYIVCVPTPYIQSTKKLDPSYIISAIHSVLDTCENGAIIVIESTVSPGTIDQYIRPEIEKRGLNIGEDIHLVHAPERIIPGNMVYELVHNSRTIGADSPDIAKRIANLYANFCEGEIAVTDIRSAEMSKVVENTYRDINIAFANELAKICHEGDMDVYEIIKLANKHPRVNIMQPGPGVGGHCISVDPWFLVGDYPGLANIILAARKINDSMPEFVLNRAYEIMNDNNLTDLSRVGLYGLTYKENVDDTRESPTLQLLDFMQRSLGEPLKSYDPYVKRDIVPNQYHDFDKFLQDIDMIIIMVAHNEIKDNVEKLSSKIVYDTRNIIDSDSVIKL